MATTAIKTGATVKWSSHGGGIKKTKKGTVLTVLKKNEDYTAGKNFPRRVYTDIMQKEMGYSREEARHQYSILGFLDRGIILERKYKVRFRITEGMERDETHYLIEVSDGKRKPYLYHPRAGETFTVVK